MDREGHYWETQSLQGRSLICDFEKQVVNFGRSRNAGLNIQTVASVNICLQRFEGANNRCVGELIGKMCQHAAKLGVLPGDFADDPGNPLRIERY
jgi:S-adenosylmethionine:diacylglycerol 3-amino-3-carboxypropyl transferase